MRTVWFVRPRLLERLGVCVVNAGDGPRPSPSGVSIARFCRRFWGGEGNGQADVLLVVMVPVFDSRPSGDLLESLAMPEGQSVAWVTVPELRRLGLLPTAVSVPGMARQRAEELRGKSFPFAAIARWLDSEGYAPLDSRREHWSGADGAKLLRQAESSSEDLASVSPASAATAGFV